MYKIFTDCNIYISYELSQSIEHFPIDLQNQHQYQSHRNYLDFSEPQNYSQVYISLYSFIL